MKKHTKIYLDYFNYGEQDFVPCEICGSRCVDVHHIENRGMGGSGRKDFIDNLMGLCRKCHTDYGDIIEFIDKLKQIHLLFVDNYKLKTSLGK